MLLFATIKDQVSGVFSNVGQQVSAILIAIAAIAIVPVIVHQGFKIAKRLFMTIACELDYRAEMREEWDRDHGR